MKKYRNIILALSVVLLLNSCLVSTAVGTVAGAAVEVVKLPFKLIGGIINIINGSNRDKEIEKVGMSKYEKKVSEILERKKETLTFGNFSVYSYKDLEFQTVKSSGTEKPMQLVDKKSNIKFSFTMTLIDGTNVASKLSQLESTEGVTKISERQSGGMIVREYTMKVNNTKDKKIENYRLTGYEKNGQVLLYQYLESNDSAYDVEEALYNDLVNNTF
ncbi:Uncharacterised protein [Sebaldella termitidis]|jgi:hypothetical protein|uniref:Lipoprotein n=1 Tax=Sebaldella termitidis (strain ATCC 33386 / NCTC 11300) TaxID=526218 RepID=D1AJ47_SEBTE|nr:hypothetical protein [Sebaldella termitidis]ACZ08735.1 hypothetical protein Sterm_1878 [Sebaldella termitidis ATCC 33386]SUI24053.1 Uncharacterised protein [Sebaldella termitidis]